MKFLALFVLSASLLCSCRTESTAKDIPSHADPGVPLASKVVQPSPRHDSMGTGLAPTDTVTHIPDVVWRYRAAWDQIHASMGPVRIPEFWALADTARYALIDSMEQFSEATFRRAESLMVWHDLGRTETVYASPVDDSFLVLARKRGTPYDTAYFAYLVSGVWGWKTPVTDYSACDEFGSPNLLTSLTKAERARADTASPYHKWFPDPAKDVRASMDYGLCACGKASATLHDFETNLSQAPIPATLRPLLDSLHAILRAPRPKDRFECSPG